MRASEAEGALDPKLAAEPSRALEFTPAPEAPLVSEPQAAATPETVSDWHVVHARMVALSAERARHERELCRRLRAAERLAVHARVGFASLREYAERVLGLRARQLEERLRVARALDRLPELDAALARGELCWSAVRELSRVATANTEKAWHRWALGRRTREIEQAVATRRPGQGPAGRPDRSLVKHRLRFEVCAETMAMFRDLQARIRVELGAESGSVVDDDVLLYEIARRALGGPSDDGRASYQIAVSRCPECMRVSMDAGGESHEVNSAVAEMVACDCQEVGRVDGRPGDANEVAREDLRHEKAASASDETSRQGRPHAGAMGVADERPHAGAMGVTDDRPHAGEAPVIAPVQPRATQTIPPRTRRAVMRRDRQRCVVPGCANHRWLDVHHVRPRSEGGTHDPDGCCSLCGSHHRAAHAGSLVIDGSASAGFRFRHADGTPYGGGLGPTAIDVTRQVLGALRHLGFSATEARGRVDGVLREGAPAEVDAFLRAALRRT